MLRSVSSNWTLNAIQIAVFMVLTRFTLNTLGTDAYGIWEVIVSAAAPLQLLALGLPMATVRAVSASIDGDDEDAASRAAGTAFTMTLLLGGIAIAIGGIFYGVFSTRLVESEHWAGLTPERAQDARLAIAVILANVSAGFALALPYALFDAHHDFVARNLLKAAGLLAKLIATVVLLSWRADLVVLAFVQVGVAVLEFFLAFAVSRVRHPRVRLRPRPIEWDQARGLLSFSVFAFLLNMGALLAFRIDALVIGFHDQPAAVAIYGMGNKIFDPFINILLAIGMVLMPMAAAARVRGDVLVVRDQFLKWSKIAGLLVFLIGGYLMVLGPSFLAWWLGDEYDDAAGGLLRILMVSFFFFLPIRGVALPVLMGLGKAKGPGIGLLTMGVINLVLSLALIGPYGIVGVALGTAIPNVLFAVAFGRTACLELEIRPLHWANYAFARPAAVMVVSAGVLLVASLLLPIEGFVPLFVAGLAYTGLFGVLAARHAFLDDRYIDISPVTARIKGLLPPRR